MDKAKYDRMRQVNAVNSSQMVVKIGVAYYRQVEGKKARLQKLSPHIHSGTVLAVRTNLEAKLFIKLLSSFSGNNYNLDAPAFFQLAIYVFDTFRNECFSNAFSLIFRHYNYICQIGNISLVPEDTGTSYSFIILTAGDDEI